jgi:hypothetical protein
VISLSSYPTTLGLANFALSKSPSPLSRQRLFANSNLTPAENHSACNKKPATAAGFLRKNQDKQLSYCPGAACFTALLTVVTNCNGIATCKTAAGPWSPPAPFSMSGGSFGLQIGGEEVGYVMLAMTDEGMQALMSGHFKVGAGVNAAAPTLKRRAGINERRRQRTKRRATQP